MLLQHPAAAATAAAQHACLHGRKEVHQECASPTIVRQKGNALAALPTCTCFTSNAAQLNAGRQPTTHYSASHAPSTQSCKQLPSCQRCLSCRQQEPSCTTAALCVSTANSKLCANTCTTALGSSNVWCAPRACTAHCLHNCSRNWPSSVLLNSCSSSLHAQAAAAAASNIHATAHSTKHRPANPATVVVYAVQPGAHNTHDRQQLIFTQQAACPPVPYHATQKPVEGI